MKGDRPQRSSASPSSRSLHVVQESGKARGCCAGESPAGPRSARLGGSRGRCRDGSAWSVELQGRSVGRGRGAVPGIARVRARKDRGGERVGREEGEVARELRLCRDARPAGGGRRQGATVAGRWAKWAFRVRLGWVFSFLFFYFKIPTQIIIKFIIINSTKINILFLV